MRNKITKINFTRVTPPKIMEKSNTTWNECWGPKTSLTSFLFSERVCSHPVPAKAFHFLGAARFFYSLSSLQALQWYVCGACGYNVRLFNVRRQLRHKTTRPRCPTHAKIDSCLCRRSIGGDRSWVICLKTVSSVRGTCFTLCGRVAVDTSWDVPLWNIRCCCFGTSTLFASWICVIFVYPSAVALWQNI